MYGIVISIANLPAPSGLACLTAVRMRGDNGDIALLFENSPVAATLMAGEWVKCAGSTSSKWGNELCVLPPAELRISQARNAEEVLSVLEHMHRVIVARGRHLAAFDTANWQVRAQQEFEQLVEVRKAYGLPVGIAAVPDDLLLHSLPHDLRELALVYLEVNRG